MKTLELADVGRLPEELKSGEKIELREEGKLVATVYPLQAIIEDRIEELAQQGKIRKVTGTVPDEILTTCPPKFSGSVLEELLEERESGW